ncbi:MULTISPECIES: hypothetical protein [Rhodobacterales]|uniref:hypothetical protein n=1 Tax=Rhodobacterales TaxID=204455 RepID=UPI0011BD6CC8|nr:MULTISPECIES: hypothetical protein [Rhodobacterales]MDO6591490.1 hypothetical protein [Yoonia sp. 1_MG-2023]
MIRTVLVALMMFVTSSKIALSQTMTFDDLIEDQRKFESIRSLTPAISSPELRLAVETYLDAERVQHLIVTGQDIEARLFEFRTTGQSTGDYLVSVLERFASTSVSSRTVRQAITAVADDIQIRNNCLNPGSCLPTKEQSDAVNEIFGEFFPEFIVPNAGEPALSPESAPQQCTPVEDQGTQLCINRCLGQYDVLDQRYHECVSDYCISCAEDEEAQAVNTPVELWNGARWIINDEITQACNGTGQIDSQAYVIRDFDGDGRDDFLLQHSGITCDNGGESTHCGTQVCSTRIFLRRGDVTPKFGDYLGELLEVSPDVVPTISLYLHGGDTAQIQWAGNGFHQQ